MRLWYQSGAAAAPEEDYLELAGALEPDRELLSRHYWRSDLKAGYGTEIDDDELDGRVDLARAIFGEHPAANLPLLKIDSPGNVHIEQSVSEVSPARIGEWMAQQDDGSDEQASAAQPLTMPGSSAEFLPFGGGSSTSAGWFRQGPVSPGAGTPFLLGTDSDRSPASPFGTSSQIRIAGWGRGGKGRGGTPDPAQPTPKPRRKNDNLPPGMDELPIERRPSPSLSPPPPSEEIDPSPPTVVEQFIDKTSSRYNAYLLRRNMLRAGREAGKGTAAHHIVASTDGRASIARKVLKEFKIDINDPDNGVFLPANSKSPNPNRAVVHSTLNTKAYLDAVNRRLSGAKTRQDALWILQSIRLDLETGNRPS